MRQRSKPISRTKSGTKTTSRSRSPRPASLEPALQPGAFRRLQPRCDFQSQKDSTGFQPVVLNRYLILVTDAFEKSCPRRPAFDGRAGGSERVPEASLRADDVSFIYR